MRIEGLGLRVQGSGLGDFGCRVEGVGFRAQVNRKHWTRNVPEGIGAVAGITQLTCARHQIESFKIQK